MAPTTALRFSSGPPSGALSHLQQTHIPYHSSQHQTSNSGGLPPPSFHHGFAQGNANPFAPTGNVNGLAGAFGPSGGPNGTGTGLGSREAMAGFAHGIQLQQQQQVREQMRRGSGGASRAQLKSRIRDVWRGNLAQEMHILRGLIDRYPYVSMVGPYSTITSSSGILRLG